VSSRRTPRLALRGWVTTRFLYLLSAAAGVLALSVGAHFLLYVAAAGLLVLGAFVAADLAAGPARSAVAIERRSPEHFALRVPADLVYDVTQRGARPIRVGVFETPVRTLRFDVEEVSAAVPAMTVATMRRPVTPVSRGRDELGDLYVWYENAIGLVRRRVVVPAPFPIRVYPDLAAVERYGTLRARNRLVEAGLRRMRLRGIGTEFESLRDYAAGDAFRTIDWKATARRGKVMVAQHEVERSQNVMLAIDCGRLMTPRLGDQRKLDYAITAALSVASIASLASDKVGAVAFAQKILVARAPRSTASSLQGLAEALYDLEPRFEESDYARVCAYLHAHLRRRSLIVLFTDVIDPLAQSVVLGELASLARRHFVLCVFMNDAAVVDALARVPAGSIDAYERDVAIGLERERSVAVTTLERAGVHVIDVPARALSISVINEYLRVKQRGLL